MAKNIIMNKKVGDNYISYYPKNNAYNIDRTSRDISYLGGDTLLEVMQEIANTYIAPHGEIWEDITQSYIEDGSCICSYNDFVCILTPYNEEATHQINMLVSFDAGYSWYFGYYFNSNTNFRINYILGADASLGNDGLYEVTFIGAASSDSSEATTYKAQFKENSPIPYNIAKFNNQIILIGGDE